MVGGGGGVGVKFLASENWCGRVHFGVTRPNGECFQNLVSNPALNLGEVSHALTSDLSTTIRKSAPNHAAK